MERANSRENDDNTRHREDIDSRRARPSPEKADCANNRRYVGVQHSRVDLKERDAFRLFVK
jgi:hypothetical protein